MRLVRPADIAKLAGVRPSAVSMWIKRHQEFPKPVYDNTQDGDGRYGVKLYSEDEVVRWLDKHRTSMGKDVTSKRGSTTDQIAMLTEQVALLTNQIQSLEDALNKHIGKHEATVYILHGVTDRDPNELVIMIYPTMEEAQSFIDWFPGTYRVAKYEGIDYDDINYISTEDLT